jgi:hypothetical protein
MLSTINQRKCGVRATVTHPKHSQHFCRRSMAKSFGNFSAHALPYRCPVN